MQAFYDYIEMGPFVVGFMPFKSEYHVLPRNEKTFVTNKAILDRDLWCDYAK